MPDDVSCWYALQTRPQAERVTAERLDRLGFVESYSPQAKIDAVRKGKVIALETPAFPTYLLCKMPAEAWAWRAASDTEGVNRMLGKDDNGTPTSLRQGEVDDIRRRESRGELEPPQAVVLRNNSAVRIRFGHFVNHLGILLRRRRERARIRLSLLGAEIELEIPIQAIEPVDSAIGRLLERKNHRKKLRPRAKPYLMYPAGPGQAR